MRRSESEALSHYLGQLQSQRLGRGHERQCLATVHAHFHAHGVHSGATWRSAGLSTTRRLAVQSPGGSKGFTCTDRLVEAKVGGFEETGLRVAHPAATNRQDDYIRFTTHSPRPAHPNSSREPHPVAHLERTKATARRAHLAPLIPSAQRFSQFTMIETASDHLLVCGCVGRAGGDYQRGRRALYRGPAHRPVRRTRVGSPPELHGRTSCVGG
jgi:hypothetical protein